MFDIWRSWDMNILDVLSKMMALFTFLLFAAQLSASYEKYYLSPTSFSGVVIKCITSKHLNNRSLTLGLVTLTFNHALILFINHHSTCIYRPLRKTCVKHQMHNVISCDTNSEEMLLYHVIPIVKKCLWLHKTSITPWKMVINF